jgi:hypothetical protein
LKSSAFVICAVLSVSACGSSDAAPARTTSRAEAARVAKIDASRALAERYQSGFRRAWNNYTQEQKKEFCWIAYDLGSYVASSNAFEAERAKGGTPEEAEAARRGMTMFISEVC